jgi:hypothetical protein
LDLDRRRAAHAVSRSAVAVHERDELGGVRATQDGDEREPLDPIASEVQGVVIETARVSERESLRLRPFAIASRPDAGEREHRDRACGGAEQWADQWFT